MPLTHTRHSSPVSLRSLLLFLSLPILLLGASMYFAAQGFWKDIRVSESELRGVQKLRVLYDNLQLIQQVRGLRQAQMGGYTRTQKELGEAQALLQQHFHEFPAGDHAQDIRGLRSLQAILSDMTALNAEPDETGYSLRQFDAYTEQVRRMQELIHQAWDQYAFSIDPSPETAHLSLVLALRLPSLSETLGRVRALSFYGALGKVQRAVSENELNYAIRSGRLELRRLRWESGVLHRTSPDHARLADTLDRLAGEVDAYLSEAAQPRSDPKMARHLLDVGGDRIALLNDVVTQSMETLSGYVTLRLASQRRNFYIVVAGALLALILLLAAGARLYRANRRAFDEVYRSRDKLEDAAIRRRAILDNVLDGIVTISEDGNIESFNKSAEQIFGYARDEVIGQNVKMLMPEPYHDRHDGYLHSFATTGIKRIIGTGRQVVGKRKDGSIFPMDLAVSEMQLGDRKMFTGMVRDITERVKTERMKTEFVSTVSHELRTPLTSIRGSLALLIGGVAGELPAAVKPLIDIAHKNSERLILLVNDILDIEKIEAGKMEFKIAPTRLMPLLRQAIDGNRAYIEQYQASYELAGDLPEVMINIDPNRLMQVLANLLSNAAKFSSPGGKVTITATAADGCVRVEVTDRGSGIPEKFRNRIFQKFAQADSSDTRKKGGTGLGLALAKAIVEQMGGSIGFDSKPNMQTTFFVEFPVWRGAAAPDIVGVAAPIEMAGRKRVLHIENDPDVAHVVKTLAGEIAAVENASSLADARRMLQACHYDLVILDALLPDGSGMELLSSLNGAIPPIPVLVFSTTEIAREDVRKVRSALIKSRTDNGQLLATIKNLLGVGQDSGNSG